MSSHFLQSLINKAKETTNNNNNNFNKNNHFIISQQYNNNNCNKSCKSKSLNQTIDNLNKEIKELEDEIRSLTRDYSGDENSDYLMNGEYAYQQHEEDIQDIKNIEIILEKYLFQSNNNNFQNNDELILDQEKEILLEKKFKNIELIKQNQLMESLTGYKIESGINRVYLDKLVYIFKGQCNNISFNIEFIVNNNNNIPSIKDLNIKVPLLYQLNFRNLLNHCCQTKSLGLLLSSFQKSTKTLLKRNQFFYHLSNLINQKYYSTTSTSTSTTTTTTPNINENKIISIPGGYYSNSLIFHPSYEPIFYLYWDIKFDIIKEQIENDIQVISNPLLYSKNQIDQIQYILNRLSVYSKLNNTNLENLTNLIFVGFQKQKELIN